jgi:hypothetical protein
MGRREDEAKENRSQVQLRYRRYFVLTDILPLERVLCELWIFFGLPDPSCTMSHHAINRKLIGAHSIPLHSLDFRSLPAASLHFNSVFRWVLDGLFGRYFDHFSHPDNNE